jgi:TRAP-type C4-dicarboxylate transport system permease large subunit
MLLVAIAFLVFLALGMPVALAIGISGALFFLQHPELPLTMIVQLPISQTQNFPLLAVPLFIFAGNLMNATGITRRFIRLSTLLTGHMRGGLAQVSVVLSSLMGGVSGSAIADAAMEARILGPDMIQQGYAKPWSACVIGFTALITATIPPGVGIILYGTVAEVSIGQLFAGGLVVGLLMMILFMVTVGITARIHGYQPARERRASAREIFTSLRETIWAMIFPLLLLVGIRFGIFTPAEVGAFACVYAILIGVFVYRELTWKKLVETLGSTVIDVGVTREPHFVILITIAFLLILGMFMDGSVIILLFTPIFLPLVKSVGVDPVHFGLIFCTIITMGNMTPPVGLAMYAVCSIMDCSIGQWTRAMVPFVLTVLVILAVLVYLPDIVLFLPRLLF